MSVSLHSSTLVGLAGATKKRKTFAEKAAKLDFVSSSQATREEQPLPIGYIPTPSHTLQQPSSMEDGREQEHMTIEANENPANEEDVEKEVGEWLRKTLGGTHTPKVLVVHTPHHTTLHNNTHTTLHYYTHTSTHTRAHTHTHTHYIVISSFQ